MGDKGWRWVTLGDAEGSWSADLAFLARSFGDFSCGEWLTDELTVEHRNRQLSFVLPWFPVYCPNLPSPRRLLRCLRRPRGSRRACWAASRHAGRERRLPEDAGWRGLGKTTGRASKAKTMDRRARRATRAGERSRRLREDTAKLAEDSCLNLPMSVIFCSYRLPRVYLKSARFKKKRSDRISEKKKRVGSVFLLLMCKICSGRRTWQN